MKNTAESLSVLFVDVSPVGGGAQRSFADLILALASRGVRVSVVTADRSPDGLLSRCAAADVPCLFLPAFAWRRRWSGLCRFALDRGRWRRPFAAALRDAAPALVHVNGVRSALLVADWIPRRIPLVLHDRDLRGPVRPGGLRRRADWLIAISRCVARRWRGRVDPERVRLIPNGFPLARLAEAAAGITPTRPVDGGLSFVLAADLVRWKKHELFLDALARARDSGAVSGAALVGRVRDREGRGYLDELRKRTRALGLENVVRFHVDAGDALPRIAAADVLVSAAADEPFGRTIVEALALGKPVTAVRGGGPEEILAACAAGRLVEATPEALAAGMSAWCDPAARAAAGPAARRRARDFDIAETAAAVLALYEEILSSRET